MRSRIALVFPPAMHPTSPPLGIASLRAYLNSLHNGNTVRLFDLNLAYHQQVLRWLDDGRLQVGMRKWDHASTARNVKQARLFLHGKTGMNSFLDISLYNHHASIYRNFTAVVDGLFENFSRRLLCGLPIPPRVREFFAELLAPLQTFKPTLLGLSVLFSQQLYFALAIARMLKDNETSVVLGGATLSVMPEPERLLGEPVETQIGKELCHIDLSSHVDFHIPGEGEVGLASLVEHVNGDLSRVPGLIYRENGQVRCNPSQMIDNLDQIPSPDFSEFDLHKYYSPLPVLPILSSRGCFWQQCAFCTHPKTYLAYREEDVETTISRLTLLIDQYGVNLFNFVDEMIHPGRFGKLAREITRSGLNIHYSAYAKPTVSFDGKLLENLYGSGARVLMWGVESGNQAMLDQMRKGTNAKEMEIVLQRADKAGIWNLVFIMFGFPGETRDQWRETLGFLDRVKPNIHALSKSRFLLLAGSDILMHPEKYHIGRVKQRAGRDPVSVAYDYEVTQGLTQEETQKLYQEQLPELMQYGLSPYFGTFRDHMLIHASAGS